MTELKTKVQWADWLSKQHHSILIAIGARIATRRLVGTTSLPKGVRADHPDVSALLATFRSLLLVSGASICQAVEIQRALKAASRSAAINAALLESPAAAARVVGHMITEGPKYASIGNEIAALRDSQLVDNGTSAVDLLSRPIWHGDRPADIEARWLALRFNLLAADKNFDYWVNWYENRMTGPH